MQTQTSNSGKWNIGQQARPIRAMIRADWPQVKPHMNEYGFVTVRAVREYDNGFTSVDIGGDTWLPIGALIF